MQSTFQASFSLIKSISNFVFFSFQKFFFLCSDDVTKCSTILLSFCFSRRHYWNLISSLRLRKINVFKICWCFGDSLSENDIQETKKSLNIFGSCFEIGISLRKITPTKKKKSLIVICWLKDFSWWTMFQLFHPIIIKSWKYLHLCAN